LCPFCNGAEKSDSQCPASAQKRLPSAKIVYIGKHADVDSSHWWGGLGV
jgi:hypothetical protein